MLCFTLVWRFTELLVALGFMVPVIIGWGAEASWRSFTTAEGLPSNYVTAIAQTSDGTLWVGTDAGLRSFYNGSFWTVEPITGTPMPVNVERARMSALQATPDGSLWVATSAGLYRRHADGRWDEHLEREAGLDTSYISGLLYAEDGTMWVGARDGLAQWNGQVWESVTIGQQVPSVTALAEDTERRLWVGGPSQVQILEAGELVETIGAGKGLPRGAELKALSRDTQGVMWLATANGMVEFAGMAVSRVYGEAVGLGNGETWAISADLQGLWIGTGSGLARLVDGTVTDLLTRDDGLAGAKVVALFRDAEGSLWVGTDTGLTWIPVGQWSVETDPLVENVPIQALLPDQGAGGCLGIAGGVLSRLPGEGWSLTTYAHPAQMTSALAVDEVGQVLVGTDAGLFRLNEGNLVPDASAALTDAITALLVDDGSLWVGTHHGLYRLADGTESFFANPSGGPGGDIVLEIWGTRAGDVWVGTLNRGASRLHQGTWMPITRQSTQDGLIDDVVLAGLEDSSGGLWFGTSRGLSHLEHNADPSDRSAWESFSEPIIAGNRVNALWEDVSRPGHIWVGTDRGLSLVVDGEASVFTRVDGLSSEWVNAIAQGTDGVLWIATDSGLTYHSDAGLSPQLVLDDPLVDNQPCDSLCRAECKPYGTKTLLFEYEGSDLSQIDGLRYTYLLQRSDASATDSMSPLSNATEHAVTHRKDGAAYPRSTVFYTFTVQALDKHFNASLPRLSQLCVKAPTFWERLREQRWFPALLAALALLLVLVVILVYRAVRKWVRYPYSDVRITFSAAEGVGRALVRVETSHVRPEAKHPLRRLMYSLFRRSHGQTGYVDCNLIEAIRKNLDTYSQETKRSDRFDEFELESSLMHIGGLLYELAFGDPIIRKQIQGLGLGKRRVRLRFCFGDQQELASLPWELLYSRESKIGFIGHRDDTALVRFVEPAAELSRRPLQGKPRVLVVMAQDREAPELELAAQKQRLDQILDAVAEHSYLWGTHAGEVTGVEVAETLDLPEQLSEQLAKGWDVLHFVGHAGLDREPCPGTSPEIVLCCEDRRGDYLALNADELRVMLTGLPREDRVPRLVLLTACNTASLASPLVQTLLDTGVDAVIGMQWEVLEEAAQIFADRFYRALANHGQVDRAVSEARHQIAASLGVGKWDWAAPVIVMRVPNGLIFEKV